jgi:hypothetical protein
MIHPYSTQFWIRLGSPFSIQTRLPKDLNKSENYGLKEKEWVDDSLFINVRHAFSINGGAQIDSSLATPVSAEKRAFVHKK